MRLANRIQQKSAASMMPAKGLEGAQRLLACVEAAGYALLRRRVLSTIALCSIVWPASLWLTAALAQAQESLSGRSGIAVTQPAQPSIARTDASDLILGMVDRTELEPLSDSAAQLANPHAAEQHSADPVLLPSNQQRGDLASLAALASAPSSSLLSAIQAKGSGNADTAPQARDNKTLVYQVGGFNFVVNSLPYSFSVSSAGSRSAAAR